jgi:hypothetical protein
MTVRYTGMVRRTAENLAEHLTSQLMLLSEQWRRSRARREQEQRRLRHAEKRCRTAEAWFSARADELADMSVSPARLREIYETIPQEVAPLRSGVPVARFHALLHTLVRLLIRHPNIEPALLLTILHEYRMTDVGNVLLRNPILPLLPLEMPEFFDRLPQEVSWRLLASADCPPVVIAAFSRSDTPTIADAARYHLRYEPYQTQRSGGKNNGKKESGLALPNDGTELQEAVHERIRLLIRESAVSCRAAIIEMHALGILPVTAYPLVEAARGITKGGETGRDPFEQLPTDAVVEAQIAEAADRTTHLWTLRQLAGHWHPAVRRAACANGQAPQDVRTYAREAVLREAMGNPLLSLLVRIHGGETGDLFRTDFLKGQQVNGYPPLRRLAIAWEASPSDDRPLLESLAQDGDRHVRATALLRLQSVREPQSGRQFPFPTLLGKGLS